MTLIEKLKPTGRWGSLNLLRPVIEVFKILRLICPKLEFRPGFHRESTQYSEQGSWYDGNRVRFRNGKPENLRGYNLFSNTAFDGTARALRTWANNDSEKLLAFGTEQKFYIYGWNFQNEFICF